MNGQLKLRRLPEFSASFPKPSLFNAAQVDEQLSGKFNPGW
jgi:hypothetical protein